FGNFKCFLRWCRCAVTATRPEVITVEAFSNGIKLELNAKGLDLFVVRFLNAKSFQLQIARTSAIDGGEPFGEQGGFAMSFEGFFELAFQFADVSDEIINGPILHDQFHRGFFADAGYAGKVV